ARLDRKHADNGPALPKLADVGSAEPILVRNSDVHLIDAQMSDSEAPLQTASPALSMAKASDAPMACLKIAKENGGLGFRNRCAYDVQFAYCAASAPQVACEKSAASASAAADAFAPVAADVGVGEREFHFRWVECAGKSGDVVPQLVHSAPPEGRCIKVQ